MDANPLENGVQLAAQLDCALQRVSKFAARNPARLVQIATLVALTLRRTRFLELEYLLCTASTARARASDFLCLKIELC